MIRPDFLAILRCPLDPSHTGLDLDGERLLCQRCRLAFPIRDGFPTLLVEEAVLPEDCKSVEQLPCQRDKTTEARRPPG